MATERAGAVTATFLTLLFILSLFLPLLFFLLFYRMVSISFVKLGIPRPLVFLLFLSLLLGGLINIPVWGMESGQPGGLVRLGPLIFLRPPQVRTVAIGVNVGGALIPLLLSLYLLPRAPLVRTGIAVAMITLVAAQMAEVVPGVG